ncbi:N-methylhydantoinase B/oxoprolinase/acetone carboxylase alpha subunit [Sphingomonas melonis]|uniref:N-methylhydantoinase B/oxoprolinase/acetone carboxylase alpha subunit n=1 Tax=Sphingomonas melonis TaxID=152682 RepID=A0A7Y9FMN0_9SPHN|nr:N-methylhydantoinase B/oxoprolinase/acetone carboxylase alpha subunit [Sphingomonas melonis]
MRIAHTFLPRQGEVAVRSTDGGGGYGKPGISGTAPSTRLRCARLRPRVAREAVIA